ncbi:MAG: hypothetical protein KDA52_18635, partial [Planctomycetaceae bacterium]|nr:hypothetical protein [Planctomycetaceae bacterium]
GLHVTGDTQVRTTIMGGAISNNTAAAQGGGLWNEAGSILVISEGTTISGNRASGASSNDGGGGLFNHGGRVAISSASIWGNMADGINGSGGGMFSTGGAVTLDNSTVSENSANGDGGGIANSGELITANATIAKNRSDADGVGGGTGGGIWIGGVVTLKNTIVAGNLVGSGITLNDLAGINVHPSSRNNLISDASSSGGLVDGNLGNIVGNGGSGLLPFSSILNSLADNGGPTLSHSLAVGSLAIDHGSNSAATDINGTPLQHDQRGIGFPRINNTIVDIGAIES